MLKLKKIFSKIMKVLKFPFKFIRKKNKKNKMKNVNSSKIDSKTIRDTDN